MPGSTAHNVTLCSYSRLDNNVSRYQPRHISALYCSNVGSMFAGNKHDIFITFWFNV